MPMLGDSRASQEEGEEEEEEGESRQRRAHGEDLSGVMAEETDNEFKTETKEEVSSLPLCRRKKKGEKKRRRVK